MSWRNPDHQYKRFKGKDHLRCEACGKGNPGYKVVYDETGPKATECRYCKHLKSFPNKSVKCECAFCKPSMKTIYGTLKDLKQYIKDCNYPKYSVLLKSIKTDLPLAAYVYDGYSGGSIHTRRSIRTSKVEPGHNYANNQEAYKLLKVSVFK